MDLKHLFDSLPPCAAGPVSATCTDGAIRIELRYPGTRAKMSLLAVLGTMAFIGFLLVCGGIGTLSPRGGHAVVAAVLIIIGGIASLPAMCLFIAFMVGSSLHASVTFDGNALAVDDFNRKVLLPAGRIRSVDFVIRRPRVLLLDPTKPLRNMFRIGPACAVDVLMDDCRLRMFRQWETPELEWLTAALRVLLKLPEHRRMPPAAAPSEVITANVSQPSRRDTKLLAAVLLVPTIFMAGVFSWQVPPGLRSHGWPTVEGRVTRADYSETRSRKGTSYGATMVYEYQVGGQSYRNDRIGFAYVSVDDPVRQLVKSHPAGSVIRVYHNPRNPADSLLLPGAPLYVWFCPIEVVLFIALCIQLFRKQPSRLQEDQIARYRVGR